jgi:hypothetical protein
MSKEQQDLLQDAYKNYLNKTRFSSDPTWLKPVPVMNMKTGDKGMGVKQYTQEEFINKCKTDEEFSNKWGVTIYTEVDNDEVWMGIVYNNRAAKVQIR